MKKHIIVEVDDDGRIEVMTPYQFLAYFREAFANAKEVTEVKDICEVCADLGNGKPVKLYAVKEDK